MVSICNVCLDEISDEDKKKIVIQCSYSHNIHKNCMHRWLLISDNGVCPGGCGEKLNFNPCDILLEEIDVSYNNKQIISCDQSICLLRIYIQLDRLILIDLARSQSDIYVTPTNILSYNSPYIGIINSLEEIIEVYVELKYALIELNNTKQIGKLFNYENIRSLIISKKNNEKHLENMREKILADYNINKLKEIEQLINRKIESLSLPKYQNSNKSKIILRIFRHISISLPTLKLALDSNVLSDNMEYVNVEDIVGILSLHRIVTVYYTTKMKKLNNSSEQSKNLEKL
jgi:hypothetical protein